MDEKHETLRGLIQMFSGLTKAHICIHDVSGILKLKELSVEFQNQMHSKDFCFAAKNSPKGYRMCIGCKMRANQKAAAGKTLFYGYCPYGLFEIVKPVVIEGKLHCIIYIGNLVFDFDKTAERIRRTCAVTGASERDLLSHLGEAQPVESVDYYIQSANLIDSYIRLLHGHCKPHKDDGEQRLHWAVSTLQDYVRSNYHQNISLKNVSKLYFINDKYIGRLFKRQTGCTFREYLNSVRLDNAAALLLHTAESVINIALDSGFQNVTYFNRVFLKRYNMPPAKYRKTIKGF